MTPEQMGEAAFCITMGILTPLFIFILFLGLVGLLDNGGPSIHVHHYNEDD